MRLNPGDLAPELALKDADGNPRTLSDVSDSRVVIYFYPAAGTPGCTKQACDFRDNLALLEGAGVAVIGVSPDEPDALRAFRESEGLTFPLLSDPDHKVMAAYGAWGEKTLYGKKVTGVIRSTVVVDGEGRVVHAFYNVRATGHVTKLLRVLALSPA